MAADAVYSPTPNGEITKTPPTPSTSSTSSASESPAGNMERPQDSRASSEVSEDAQSAEASPAPTIRISPHDSVDFVLHPAEVAKGLTAAENYLSSFRNEESRLTAEEVLETLATVISGGKCASLAFPWQQVRPYHGAAALTILKEKGAPARVEALRCRRDSTRNYRVVPESYPARHVQKIRSTLTKVIEECSELGFVVDPDQDASATTGSENGKPQTKSRGKSQNKAGKPLKAAVKGRLLSSGELRALTAKAAAHENAEGFRDAVFFALVYRGLKVAEITALGLDSIRFSSKMGQCHIVARAKSGGRGRRVELTNSELIYLEDWLDRRGPAEGPLLCTLGRAGKVEGKRLTVAMLKQISEARALEAEVEAFTPNDLSRSADALTDHRKARRRKASKNDSDTASVVDQVLFEDVEAQAEAGEKIRFPFLGLGI